MFRTRFTARETSKNDCTRCHNSRGIWRDPIERTIHLCDDCLADYFLDDRFDASHRNLRHASA